ncbi:MAG: 3-phosphoshikimate 1-carboxyvinyltransferase [Nitrosomonadales bacterium SCN 54-20]|nr:MAG: 3-phosphoshikimate 1-carboxyvinyltransferase [Nitrosomonadales bacterium SCN 54-20]
MEFIDLPAVRRAQGIVRLPGSKSISNRILLLAALSEGVTDICGLLASDDTARMLDALSALGVSVLQIGKGHYRVQGVGSRFPLRFPATEADLFLGNAGTVFRPLTAVLALAQGHYRLSGVPRMHERPIGDLVDALRQAGANITYLGKEGFPPLQIKPGQIHPGEITVRGNVSSQFLTALLMVLPFLRAGKDVLPAITVTGELISQPYIDLTLALMARFGVQVEREGWRRFAVSADQRYRSLRQVSVEGDASSASYFLAAGAVGGGPVRVEGIGRDSVQGDIRFAEALEQMGADIRFGDNWLEAGAPGSGSLRAIDLDCNHIPDAAMTLAVTALFAQGTTILRNIASWRVKETDRIAAMAQELRKLGAEVGEGCDFLQITPPAGELVANAAIDTYDDHRMAMCFSLASFGAPVRINDPRCVSKTFPDYFEKFAAITHAGPVQGKFAAPGDSFDIS